MVADGYKETEIGVIPVEWEVVELEKGCNKIVGGGTPSKNNNSYWENGTILWATPTEFTKNNSRYISTTILKITQDGLENSSATLLKKGTVIMSSRATIGECKINTIEMTTNQGFISYECNEKLNNIFLLYLIGRYKSKIIKVSSGSTFLEVSKTTMRNFKIPLPPLKEQEKIADILSTADEKIDAIEEQIQKAETLKKGLLQKLLSEGIGHSEFKDSELGKIPESWEVVDLGKVANITKLAGYEFTEHFNYEAGGDIIALRALNVVNGKLNLDSVQRVSTTISNKLPRSKLYINDILMTYVGTLGEFAIIEENDKFHLAPNVAKITMNSQEVNISKYILYYLMSNNGQKQIKLLSTTTSQPAINMENIRKIKIPLPPLEEQKQIANILSTADEKLEVLRAKKEKYETLKIGLLQKLLSGEIRV